MKDTPGGSSDENSSQKGCSDDGSFVNDKLDSGTNTPRTLQKKMMHGTHHNLMGLLEEVGSLGSLEDEESSQRVTNPLNLVNNSNYQRQTSQLEKSQVSKSF